ADAEAAKQAAERKAKEFEAQKNTQAKLKAKEGLQTKTEKVQAENCAVIDSWHWTKEAPPGDTYRSYDVWKYNVTVVNNCDKKTDVCVNFRALANGGDWVTNQNVC